MSNQKQWSPFDCLAVAETTRSGLLQKNEEEVELLVQNKIELRATGQEPLVPLTSSQTVDVKKSIQFYVDREEPLQLVVTTHRLVLFRNNSTNQNQSREARYIHLSNVFVCRAETAYFKSPKIVLLTAIGDLVLAYTDRTNTDPKKQRDECLEILNKALSRQEWEKSSSQQQRRQQINGSRRRVGVDAILNASANRHQQAKRLTDTAFEGDVEDLLKEATSLVRIIHKYVAALDREESMGENNNQLIDMLSDMGMASAVAIPKNHRNNDDFYYDQMARQMADVVRPKLKCQNGIMTLTDVFCYWNRARTGSHLVSPEEVLKAVEKCHELPELGLCLRTFDSGLKVLQETTSSSNTRDNDQVLFGQFVELCEGTDGFVTHMIISRQFHLPAVLALEQLLQAEQAEYLVRDETLEGLRFYPNCFLRE